MASIDIDSLKMPVDSDLPAGEDLEYDPLFSEMEQAAAGKPQQQMGDAIIDAEEPDWRLVQRNAVKLLERSKDLRVCVYLCESALQNEGIEGLSEALQLTNVLATEFWSSVHPALDEDDDDDPTARVNAVMALTSPARLLRALEHAPLISVPMLGSVCWADVKPATGDEEPQQNSAEVEAIINNCEPEQIADRRVAVAAALDVCQSLETFITAQVGASRAPNLQPLRDVLKRINTELNRWWDQRGGEQAGDQASEDAQSGDGQLEEVDDAATTAPRSRAETAGVRAGGPIGTISSRQEAIAAIDKVLEYYYRHEPSSPLPLLLARAKRLATKSFIEILQDLIPEGLSRAHEIGGLMPSSGNGARSEDAAEYPADPVAAATEADSSSDSDDLDDDFFR